MTIGPVAGMNRGKLWAFLGFAVLNFLGLALGGLATGPGVQSTWYAELPQAPWTPPGWVFGAAWTTVMLGFSAFMAGVWSGTAGGGMPGASARSAQSARSRWLTRFAVTWMLNVAWNPVFFAWHQVGAALLVLGALLAAVVRMAWSARQSDGTPWWWWGIVPYVLWLGVASSLNGYSWLAGHGGLG